MTLCSTRSSWITRAGGWLESDAPEDELVSEMSRVVIVVDARFADQIPELTRTASVWARKGATGSRSTEGVTVFNESSDLGYLIEEVVLHHGPASGGSDFDEIEVLGSTVTEAARDALTDHGFVEVRPTVDGFIARRPST